METLWSLKRDEEVLQARDRQLEDPRRPMLKQMVIDRGELWAVAAMIEGSIGYHGYTSARNRIRSLMEDKYIYACERTSACFRCDSVAEIEHDFRVFSYLEESHPDRVMGIVRFAEATSKLDDWSQTGVGLMYPTMGVGGS